MPQRTDHDKRHKIHSASEEKKKKKIKKNEEKKKKKKKVKKKKLQNEEKKEKKKKKKWVPISGIEPCTFGIALAHELFIMDKRTSVLL